MSDTKQPKPKIFDRYSLLEGNATDKENRGICKEGLETRYYTATRVFVLRTFHDGVGQVPVWCFERMQRND